METQYDFYQFRWLVTLALNQLLILFSVGLNPVHSLILLGFLTYPLLNVLQIADLKKIDPYNTLLKKESDDILPRSGLATNRTKWDPKSFVQEYSIDTVFSVCLMIYLMSLKEDVTPDFFHFVMCLGEDLCHTIWVYFLWFTYKCFLICTTSSD
jgi:hypothetical protein